MNENNQSWLSSKNEAFLKFATGTELNRIGRLKYLARNIVFGIVMGIIIGILYAICGYIDLLIGLPVLSVIVGFCCSCLTIYGSIVIINKRLHDFGKSGWWQLLLLIPIVNIIFLLVLIFSKGTDGENKYGVASETKSWEKVLGRLYPALIIIVTIGILSAALLPRLQVQQSKHHDALRRSDISDSHSAMIAYFNANGRYPLDEEAEDGIELSAVNDVVKGYIGKDLPKEPDGGDLNSGLGTASSTSDYLYMVTTKNTIKRGGFALMAKTTTKDGSNWVVCDNGEGILQAGYDLSKIKVCNTITKGSECSNYEGNCTYTSNKELRYIYTF